MAIERLSPLELVRLREFGTSVSWLMCRNALCENFGVHYDGPQPDGGAKGVSDAPLLAGFGERAGRVPTLPPVLPNALEPIGSPLGPTLPVLEPAFRGLSRTQWRRVKDSNPRSCYTLLFSRQPLSTRLSQPARTPHHLRAQHGEASSKCAYSPLMALLGGMPCG